MEHVQKQKAVREETDHNGEGDKEEDTEKDKRAGWTKLQAFWSDLKGGHRNKRGIQGLKCKSGKTIDEHTEVLCVRARQLTYIEIKNFGS